MKRFSVSFSISACLVALVATTSALAAVPNSFVMNEVSMVSGSDFLEKGRADSSLGRVQGNGQNWWEFLVVAGDTGKNTLDLRGWTIEWSYHKLPSVQGQPDNLNKFGNGTITFSQAPLWSAVPRGTMLTMSEWQDVWYTTASAGSDPFPGAGGLQRAGGIAGLGTVHGDPFNPAIHTKIGVTPGSTAGADPLFTNTTWNPAANSGGANGDWRMHVYAGERNPDNSFKYFSFTGSVTDGANTYPIGSDDAGLFAINNDLWRYSIKDAQGNVIQGPIGEWDPNAWNANTNSFGAGVPGSNSSVSSTELYRLEAFDQNTNPTQANYLGVGLAQYVDGSTSTFGSRNAWSSGAGQQGLNGLRSWLLPGDADLDGRVSASDYVILRNNQGGTGDWRNGDFNGDGAIDNTDLDIWRANFGLPAAGSGAGSLAEAAVPEPASIAITCLGGLVITLLRRRG